MGICAPARQSAWVAAAMGASSRWSHAYRWLEVYLIVLQVIFDAVHVVP